MLGNIKNQIHQIFTSPVFLSCITSWFFAQLIKTLIKLLTGKVSSIKQLFNMLFWQTGGMPSSHSALVVSVSTSIGVRWGISSDFFILALCFALVVVRDALGVRRASGIQAKAINEIGEDLEGKGIIRFKPIKVVYGHRPIEVIVGCLLGFFIGLAFTTL
jgi:acid phosphatase family membrane protein YuiD